MQNQKKSFLWIGVAAILIAASVLVPAPAGLGREGLSAIAILLASIILWISEALPLAITTLLCCTLLPLFAGNFSAFFEAHACLHSAQL